MKRINNIIKLLLMTSLMILSLVFTVYATDTTPEIEPTPQETEAKEEPPKETETEPLPDIKIGRVTGLVSVLDGTTVTLKWNPTLIADYYNVYQIKDKVKTQIATKVKGTSYKIENLSRNVGYTYTVTAVSNVKGEGEPAVQETIIITSKKPATPKNFILNGTYLKTVAFKWSKLTGINGYDLFIYSDSAGKFIPHKSLKKGDTAVTISGLQYGPKYRFHLRSYVKAEDGTKIYSEPSKAISIQLKEPTSTAKKVRGARYKVTAKKAFKVKLIGTGITVNIKKGQKFTASNRSDSVVTCYLSETKKFSAKRSLLNYYGMEGTASNDYSTKVKEEYVNKRNLYSETKWLIWISELKYKVNLFKKTNGKWKLVKASPCVVGKWKERTHGDGKILKKVAHGKYGTPTLWFDKYKGTYSNPNGCAFHQYIDSNTRGNYSKGCVRLPSDMLYYMYNNVTVGTRVLIL